MSQLLDFFPLLAFLVTLWITKNPFAATAVLMAGSVVQIVGFLLWKRKVEKLHLFNLALALVLGAATLLLHNVNFIKWKPTAALWIFSAIILGRQLRSGTLTIKNLALKIAPDLDPRARARQNAAAGPAATPESAPESAKADLPATNMDSVPDSVWSRVNVVWGVTLLLAGALNLVIAYTLPLNLWALYKVFGVITINIALVVYTAVAVQKHQRPGAEEPGDAR